ncbi:uncharacterized protein BDV17DRAFT_220150 [Aspergillus undulatus]|uniref:uncharacterized protein n=1 Tax=Aspergillus undulatus TaxID=1810928 RepID=UPI003CCE233C
MQQQAVHSNCLISLTMADNSPSLIPFLGAMTATGGQGFSPKDGPMAPYPKIEDMESQDPYPPQSYHTRQPSRSIYIDFTGWTQSHVHVREGGPRGAVIYTLDLTSRDLQMKFFAAGSRTTLASVKASSPDLEATIRGHRISMYIWTRLKKEAKFNSPSLQGASLTWKSRSMKVVDFELRDVNSIPLSQFHPHPSWSRRKAGRLDLFGPSVSNGQLMEEIMVTAFALVHSTGLQLDAATGGSAASP